MADPNLLASFYDAESAGADELAEDVPFLLERLPAGSHVLEVGVGTGRAAAQLRAAGHRVTGVDGDAAMLRIASDRLGQDVPLLRADAAEAVPDGPFDAAVLLFNTFLHFATPDRQDALLANLRRVLRPGGVLWIDTQNPDLPLILDSEDGREDLGTVHFEADGRSVMRTTTLRGDLIRQVQLVTFTYHWFEDGEERTATREFETAWTMPRELVRLLAAAGFEVVHLWGNYDGGGVDADAPRLIVEARKLPA